MKKLLFSKCLFFCASALLIVEGSDLSFTANPSSIQIPMTGNLTLRCSLADSSPSIGPIIGRRDVTHSQKDVMYVTSMVITREGKDLASMTEHIPATLLVSGNSAQTRGQLSNNQPEKGFLEVVWQYPNDEEVGSYQCLVSGVDKSGHSFTFSKSLDLTAGDVTIGSLALQLSSMKQMLDSIKNQLNLVKYPGGHCDQVYLCAGDLQCLNGRCGCLDGQYLIGDVTCVPAMQLGETCDHSDQCNGQDAKCVNFTCVLTALHSGGQCNATHSCAGDLRCSNGVCGCPSGQYATTGDTCTVKLGDMKTYSGGQCTTTHDCAGHLICLNGKCGCPDGQYNIKHDVCAATFHIGDACTSSDQCIGTSMCDLTCKCPVGYANNSETCSRAWRSNLTQYIDYGNGGVITSPYWPNTYKDNMNMYYLITTDPGKVIRISFTFAEFESYGTDYLDVFDGVDMLVNMLVRITYHDSRYNGASYISSSNSLYLHFKTDGSAVYRGFRATFSSVG